MKHFPAVLPMTSKYRKSRLHIKTRDMVIDPQDDTGDSSDDEPESARLAQTEIALYLGGLRVEFCSTVDSLLGIALARKEYFDYPLTWWSKHSHTHSMKKSFRHSRQTLTLSYSLRSLSFRFESTK